MVVKSRVSIGPVRSPDTHRAILDAATQMLRDHGFGGFSIDAVARSAGASKPTIYKWWGNKAALILEVYANESERLLVVPDLGSLEKELVRLCRNLWKLWRTTPCGEALRGLISEAQHNKDSLKLLHEELMPQRLKYPQAVFERAIARGELQDTLQIATAIELLNAFNWYRLLTDQLIDDKSIESHVHLLAKGLHWK